MKSRKLAWVVLGVVLLAVLATGIASWRFLLYEELARLTNQPVQGGHWHRYYRGEENEALRFSLREAARTAPSMPEWLKDDEKWAKVLEEQLELFSLKVERGDPKYPVLPSRP